MAGKEAAVRSLPNQISVFHNEHKLQKIGISGMYVANNQTLSLPASGAAFTLSATSG
jgi:hypothetical protein